MSMCIVCGNKTKRSLNKYCSNKCQSDDRYNKYIKSWKAGQILVSGGRSTRNISKHIRRYLMEKYGNKCPLCGWNKRNIITSRVPLEVDHINGNSEDDIESNLRIICPNCHSLSPNFRNLNKGKGRSWRRSKKD